MKLKTGDKVVVISGANKGKEGKITKVLDDKVIVEGVNVCKKHLTTTVKIYKWNCHNAIIVSDLDIKVNINFRRFPRRVGDNVHRYS